MQLLFVKLVMIGYSHLQAKCELKANFSPCMINPWVHHDCVLAPPRQMLLDNKHVKNSPECIPPITFRVAGVRLALHWELATHLQEQINALHCNEDWCKLREQGKPKPPHVAMLACSLVFLNFAHRHHLIQSSNLMLCCVWLD